MSESTRRPLEIEVKLAYEDFRRILFFLSWQRLWLFWIILPIAAVFLAIAVFSSGTITSPLAYLAPIFPLVIMGFLAYNVVSSAKAQAAQARKIQYLFSDDYVQVKSSEIDERIDWKNFVSVHETKSDFLLIEANSQIHQLPKRCFSPEKLSDFKDILQRKVESH